MSDVPAVWATDIPGLDIILGGGLSRHTLTLFVGAPGAGKTILASQIINNVAMQGVPTVIFTSYSEGNEPYIEHLQGFDFFDPALVGQSIQLFSLQGLISSDDTSPAVAIARMIRTSGARTVLIDGFQGISSLFDGVHNIRTFLAMLAGQMRYLDVTLLLTLAGDAHNPILHAAITVADIVIGLEYTVQGRRHQRLLEVVKQRGRSQLAGLHSYMIERSGIRVFPRIEVYPRSASQPLEDTRMRFGFAELDNLLNGGLNTGTTTLLAGAPGVGKTILGLAWGVSEARPDSKTVFISFSEFPDQLIRKAAAFHIDLEGAIDRGAVQMIRIPSTELNVDYLSHLIITEMKSGKVCRFICDDIAIVLHELGDRARDYFGALNDMLYEANVTSMYLLEIPAFDGLRLNVINTPLAIMGDNVIVIQQYETEGVLRRILAVLRMKLSLFDRTLRELVLDQRGVSVAALQTRILGLLDAGTRLSRGSPQTPIDPPSETKES